MSVGCPASRRNELMQQYYRVSKVLFVLFLFLVSSGRLGAEGWKQRQVLSVVRYGAPRYTIWRKWCGISMQDPTGNSHGWRWKMGGKEVIDLRSDTVTSPSTAMRKAMSKAVVGDDVFRDDPTTIQLEKDVAAMLGKEEAVFTPTGVMANLIANLVWCNIRGSEMILGDRSHIYLMEQGNAAAYGGISYCVLPNSVDGTIPVDRIRSAIRPKNVFSPVTSLITLENTHTDCGGRVLPECYMASVSAIARASGVKLHLDGARLWNAAAALGVEVGQLASEADSASVCFSKGLGAPAGSALCGSKDFIARARRVRTSLGGGMRQVGILAAAAQEGICSVLPRLADDHANAMRLAEGLSILPNFPFLLRLDPGAVETNIVLADVGDGLKESGYDANDIVSAFQEKGLLAVAMNPSTLRFVTHIDICEKDISRAISIVGGCLRDMMSRPGKGGGAGRWVPPPIVDEPFSRGGIPNTMAIQTGDSAAVRVGQEEVATDAAATAMQPHVLPTSSEVSSHDSKLGATTGVNGGMVTPPLSMSEEVLLDSSSMPAGVGTEIPLSCHAHTEEAEELYEKVDIVGMTVSEEGFISILSSPELGRSLKVLITPADPMSEGLDRHEPGTPEAMTLLQLLQGIDVGSYLPPEELKTIFDFEVKELNSLYLHEVRPYMGGFNATLTCRNRISRMQQHLTDGSTDVKGALLLLDSQFKGDDTPSPAKAEPQYRSTLNSGFKGVALALRYGARIYVKRSLLLEDGEGFSFDNSEIYAHFPEIRNKATVDSARTSQHSNFVIPPILTSGVGAERIDVEKGAASAC